MTAGTDDDEERPQDPTTDHPTTTPDTTRLQPHEQLLVGWMTGGMMLVAPAPGDERTGDDRAPAATPTSHCSLGGSRVLQGHTMTTTTPNSTTGGTTTTSRARRRHRAPRHPPPRLRATARRVDDGCGSLRRRVGARRGRRPRRRMRHPPHAYELMHVGWIVGATDDERGTTGKQERGPRGRRLQRRFLGHM